MADTDTSAHTGQVRSGKMTAHRSCLVVNVLLGICCLSLFGVVGWLAYEKNIQAEKSIWERFPGLFRTEEERAQVERGAGSVPVTLVGLNTSAVHNQCVYTCDPDTIANGSTTTRFSNNRVTPDTDLDQCPSNSSMPVTYNACCITKKGFIKPTELPSAKDKNVTFKVVQFPKVGLFQFFSVQECCQAANCGSCKCTQTNYVVTALVERPHKIMPEFDLVLVPGCCQCQNKGSASLPSK